MRLSPLDSPGIMQTEEFHVDLIFLKKYDNCVLSSKSEYHLMHFEKIFTFRVKSNVNVVRT